MERQLRKLGVADETYDAIVSSGDLTRHFVADHPGQKIFWIGPERDSSIHRGLDATLVPLEQADYIICTGLFDDETESAEDYRDTLLKALERKLTLVCANPDIVVERGDRLILLCRRGCRTLSRARRRCGLLRQAAPADLRARHGAGGRAPRASDRT